MWRIIIVLFLIIAYLFFAKIFIEIDSSVDRYKLSFGRVLVLNILFINDSIQLELKIFWWKKTVDLSKTLDVDEYKTVKMTRINNSNVLLTQKLFSKASSILKSFKIKKCFITIDTGIMPLNGILYPWFHLLSIYMKKNVSINFLGKNIIILQVENSFARMLWAYFKS